MGKEDISLGDVLKNIIKNLGSKERLKEEEIIDAWAEVVGESASKHTRPASLKAGVLAVTIDSSAWLYELTTGKKRIVQKLSEKLKGKKIKDVRFRMGEIKKEKGKSNG